jgi:hypothetical protein
VLPRARPQARQGRTALHLQRIAADLRCGLNGEKRREGGSPGSLTVRATPRCRAAPRGEPKKGRHLPELVLRHLEDQDLTDSVQWCAGGVVSSARHQTGVALRGATENGARSLSATQGSGSASIDR